MTPPIATFFYSSSFYLRCVRCQERFSFSSRTALPHTKSPRHCYLLEQETLAIISLDQWPPNSPYLNPVDYKIWCVIQQRVYQSRVHSVEELKQRLLHVWHGIEQCIIDCAIDVFEVACDPREDILSNCCNSISNS